MIKYKGKEYSTITELCDTLNITQGQFKREYEKCKNSRTAIQRCLVINNKVITEVSDEDTAVNYDLAKGSLRELAKSLKIDYKTLVKNLETMDIKNAIKAGKEAKPRNYAKDNPHSKSQLQIIHEENINRINLILKRIDVSTNEIQYLLRANADYKNWYEQSVSLYQALLLIYHTQEKGENKRYTAFKEKIAKKIEKELEYVMYNMQGKLYTLGVTEPHEVIKGDKELLTGYRESIAKTLKINSILAELCEEQYRVEQEKRRIEWENEIAEQHKKDVRAIIEKLSVPFKLKLDMLDKRQFNNTTDICNIINNYGFTIEIILRYTLNNKLNDSIESFAEMHLKNNKESLGHQIGRLMVKSGVIRSRKSYAEAGINGLAKMALEMLSSSKN